MLVGITIDISGKKNVKIYWDAAYGAVIHPKSQNRGNTMLFILISNPDINRSFTYVLYILNGLR